MLQRTGEEVLTLILDALGKGGGPELLAPITSNQNEQKFNKNLKVIMRVTKAQLPI
jgi:hypothetical protein